MKEQFIPSENTREARLSKMSFFEKEELESSRRAMEDFIKRLEGVATEKNLKRVEGLEHKDEKTTLKWGEELNEFGNKFFEPVDNMDPMSHAIGIKNGLVDNHLVRNEEGKIVSALQSQLIELPEESGKPKEAFFTVWYVGTDPNYSGKPVTREIFVKALHKSLAESQEKLLKISGIVGETAPDVEKLFNRYGVDRAYYKDAKGVLRETPYRTAPEDESEEGTFQHLALKFFDDRKEVAADEIAKISSSLHAQSCRPEYLSAEYFRFAQEWYNRLAEDPGDKDTTEITEKRAERYRDKYIKKVQKTDEKFTKEMQGAADGKVFLMSERERRERIEKGEKIIELNVEE